MKIMEHLWVTQNNNSKVQKETKEEEGKKTPLKIKAWQSFSLIPSAHPGSWFSQQMSRDSGQTKKKKKVCNDVNIRSQLNTQALTNRVSWCEAGKWAEFALFSQGNFCSLTSVSLSASSAPGRGKVSSLHRSHPSPHPHPQHAHTLQRRPALTPLLYLF